MSTLEVELGVKWMVVGSARMVERDSENNMARVAERGRKAGERKRLLTMRGRPLNKPLGLEKGSWLRGAGVFKNVERNVNFAPIVFLKDI